MAEPEGRLNVSYDWKPADGVIDSEELEYWELAMCVFCGALLDKKVGSPVIDSWELDQVLLIDDGTNELDDWLTNELAVGKFPDDDVLGEGVVECIVLEELNEN